MKTATTAALVSLHAKLGEVAALMNAIRANSMDHSPLQQDAGYSQNLLQEIFNNFNTAFREVGVFDDEVDAPAPAEFQEGYDSAKEGFSAACNPYIADTAKREDFHAGWKEAASAQEEVNLAFQEGFAAGKDGLPVGLNPFLPGSIERAAFNDGWNMATI